MKTVLLIFGTRPEAIKMCPLVNEFKKHPESFNTKVCVTGQHREMLDAVLKVFNVVPDYDLSIMKASQTLFDITSEILLHIGQVINDAKPDIVLVHGDTTTSFASALASFYLGVPVGHVEAGLRTGNMQSPFPEEFNRQAVDLITNFYFAPTELAKNNLLQESKPDDRIFVTGNTGIDALKTTVKADYSDPLLDRLGSDDKLILVTAHRRENLGGPMHHMLRAIRKIAEDNPEVRVIYPVHLNPKVREVANQELGGCETIWLIDPLNVLDFHNYMARSYLILTDSGGIQEEAPSLGKPVLVMRDTTERPEGVSAGTLKLAGTSEESIYQECSNLLHSEEAYRAMSQASNPYGDGKASMRIVQAISELLPEKER